MGITFCLDSVYNLIGKFCIVNHDTLLQLNFVAVLKRFCMGEFNTGNMLDIG